VSAFPANTFVSFVRSGQVNVSMIHFFCTGICTTCHCTAHSVVLAHISHRSFSSGVFLTIDIGFLIISIALSIVF